MEKLHSSRPWRKSTIASSVIARSNYDEVFGGLQSHRSPFSLQLQDYFEIFGSAASAFSIPLLDLPPTDDETMRECGGVINYSDVFEKFGGGGLGDSYEELFPEPKRSEVSSSLGSRTQCDVLSEHQEKKDLEEQLSGLCNYVSSKQFMSHPIMGQVPLDGVISEDIPEAKLDAIPEYSIDVNTINSAHEMKNETVNRGTISSTDTKKRSLDGGEQNDAETYISSGVINSMVNLKSDMTHPKSICVSVLNVSSDEKNHSPSSSYHSTSSGDIPLDGVTFLHVSEIGLRTKPLQGPPPSRSPPELSKKAEHSKMMFTDSRSYVEEGRYLKPKINDQLCSKSEATNINKINDSIKNISRLQDAEMDPSSAAALSIAAVKEAMEQAQARIKSAKEMNHKKRDKCHMKLDLLKTLNINEGGVAPEVEPKNRSNRIEANNLFGKSNMVSTYTFVEREKNSIEGKAALNHVEIEVQLPPYRTDQQHMAKNSVSKSPELAFKIGEIPGEWKRDNELTGNDGFLNTETGINIQGDEKKGPVICSCEDKEKDIKNLRKAIEIEENKKSTEISFFQFSNTASTEEVNKNLFATSLDASLARESANELKETQTDENQKVNDAQEDSTNDDKVSNPNSSVLGSCLHKKSEESSHNSNLVLELGVANEHCGERQLKVAGVSGACLEAICEKGIRVPEEFKYNSTNKKEVAEELKLRSKYDTKSGSTIHQNSYDEFGCMVEKSDSAIEKDEHDGLQTNEQTHIFVENELQQELIHDKNELESAKMQGKIKYAEHEQVLHCKKGPYYRDCNIKGSREVGIGVQETESMEALMNPKSSEILEPNKGSYCERLSKNIIEVPVPNKFVENQISLNLADKTCHLADIEESDVQLDFLSRMEGNLLAAAEDAKGVSHTEMADNHKHSFREEEKNRRKMNIVIESDEEQEKRLKENRERDKITVEQPNDEARQQAVTEALKRAERIAVERATSEARQRALADAREKAEKAAEAAKASREARLRAERAAVERATEEARIRAIEKALAEKAVAGAREVAAQVSSSNKDRMRKDNGTAHFNATHHIKGDSEARYKSSSTQIPRNSQSHTASCSTNGQRSSDSSKNGKTESNMRFKAGEGRQQQTAELAANAPCERNMRDILAQREQAERDRLAESFDVMVRRWSFGKDGNLRSLLSTLEYILAPESGWQPIPPTELVNVPAVKKAYRKATLCVHPDKLQQRGASIQQKYICEKVFDLLKEAWDKFNTEER